jgi:hypothetical protein
VRRSRERRQQPEDGATSGAHRIRVPKATITGAVCHDLIPLCVSSISPFPILQGWAAMYVLHPTQHVNMFAQTFCRLSVTKTLKVRRLITNSSLARPTFRPWSIRNVPVR